MNICLCEDEPAILNHYRELTAKTVRERSIPAEIRTFANGEQLLFHLLENPNEADIIFLDMLMGGVTGFDTAKQLRAAGCVAEIIYLTSNREMVFDAFDTTPFHYLIKSDTTEDRFAEVLLKAVEKLQEKNSDFFICTRGAVIKKVPVHKISHFTIDDHVVTMYYQREQFEFYKKFGDLQTELRPKGFARCYKSVLVNLQYVDEIQKKDIILTTGDILPFGERYVKEFKLAFAQYLSKTEL